MGTTETVSILGKLVEALATAKGSIKTPTKTKTGKVSGMSKSGKAYEYEYKYADRADVIEAYKKPLADNGLVLAHAPETVGDGLNLVLVSRLIHTGGGEIVSRIPIPQTKDAQSLGSWLTYMERYAACALLDIAAEDDDDGQRAGARGKKREAAPTAPPPPVTPAYPCISEEQAEAIRAAAKKAGIKTKEDFAAALVKFSGVNETRRIAAEKYEHVMEQMALLSAPASQAVA